MNKKTKYYSPYTAKRVPKRVAKKQLKRIIKTHKANIKLISKSVRKSFK